MVQQTRAATTEEFMATAAHDLRNPAAVVRASAQMAQRQLNRGDIASAQARLQTIVEQTDRLTEMLESFVDAARIESGHLEVRPERLNLRDLVDIASQSALVMVTDKSRREIAVDVPEACMGAWDRTKTTRAIRALVTNALLYGDPAVPVQIEATRSPSHVSLVITGGGSGPTDDDANRLFERFFRGRRAADAEQSGSGLGLYTARGIARAHGGDVRWLEGDRFQIELPLVD